MVKKVLKFPTWHDSTGQPLACVEKIKVMRENLDELAQMAQDTFEDALLMGCEEGQIRDYLVQMMHSLHNHYFSEDRGQKTEDRG